MINQIAQHIEQAIWRMNLARLSPVRRMLIQFIRILVASVSAFLSKELSTRAGHLAYTTLLSLVPFLAVTFSVLKAFGVHQQLGPVLEQALEPLGAQATEITTRVVAFVDNLQIGILGAIGLLGLFYTTFTLIDNIEVTFNVIWNIREGRPFKRKVTDYLSAVLIGPVLVFTSFAIIASAQSYWVLDRLLAIQPLGHLIVVFSKFLPLVFLTAAFTFLYKFLPFTRVDLSSALVGGLVAGILWQLGGWAFAAFVAQSTRYDAIYSGFAILILFLIWLYVGWSIVLTGAQVSFFHQHPPLRNPWGQETESHSPVFQEWVALKALTLIAQAHLRGEMPYVPKDLASYLDVSDSFLDELLSRLVEQQVLCLTADPEGRIALGRSPSTIYIWDVLAILSHQEAWMGEPWMTEPSDPVANLLRERNQIVKASLQDKTLQELALMVSAKSAEDTILNFPAQAEQP